MQAEDLLILVDDQDQEIGFETKLKTHQQGLLHRAFSIFVFRKNDDGEIQLLLQERAHHKYHSGGLWTNTCCSHPRKGETLEIATQRRMMEEFGFQCDLSYVDAFIYKAQVGGLIEHEYDHVFVGYYRDQKIEANPEEIAAYKWMKIDSLEKDLEMHPQRYTAWFKQSYEIAKKVI